MEKHQQNGYTSVCLGGKTEYEHRQVAANMLGRRLYHSEVVHHIDQNRSNNDPKNLIVFKRQSDHSRFHQYGCDSNYLHSNGDGTYSCKKRTCICANCHIEFNRGIRTRRKTDYCSKQCSDIGQRKVQRPDKKTLQNQVNELGYKGTGQLYGVSDNAVRKWLK